MKREKKANRIEADGGYPRIVWFYSTALIMNVNRADQGTVPRARGGVNIENFRSDQRKNFESQNFKKAKISGYIFALAPFRFLPENFFPTPPRPLGQP